MNTDITGLCHEHSFEKAVDVCRMCGGEFCDMCLLYPSGKPLCKACAIAASGVRSGAAHKALGSRDIKNRVKQFEAAREPKQAPAPTAPVITDPLTGHDPIGPPNGQDLDLLGHLDADADADSEPGVVARTVARLARTRTGPDDGDEADDSPGGDIAPRIDWTNPFG